jgi:FkbM family methyltransferase
MAQMHPAFKLARVLDGFKSAPSIRSVWEVGSRDGADAAIMCQAFPEAIVTAFEPNPATYSKLLVHAEASGGRISPRPEALTDEDGPLPFMQIDVVETVTSWPDGNPGASSLFEASGLYDGVEKYVQRRISVEGARADTIISKAKLPSPDLVWMDVQGAELLALKGFGDSLENISLIYVELSLKPIYNGQALASDVVDFLNPCFYWFSVMQTGRWQFDAVFISKRISSGTAIRIRDSALRTALRLPLQPGIARSAKPIDVVRHFWRRAKRAVGAH